MDEAEFETFMNARKAEAEMPGQFVASAHFRRDSEMLVRTCVFDATTPMVDVYRWASTCEGVLNFERPFRLVISPGEAAAPVV